MPFRLNVMPVIKRTNVRLSSGLEDAVLFIESILDQWNTPDAQYFRVLVDDGNTYVLGHHQNNDAWVLESFRSEEQGVVTTDSDAASTPNGAE